MSYCPHGIRLRSKCWICAEATGVDAEAVRARSDQDARIVECVRNATMHTTDLHVVSDRLEGSDFPVVAKFMRDLAAILEKP